MLCSTFLQDRQNDFTIKMAALAKSFYSIRRYTQVIPYAKYRKMY